MTSGDRPYELDFLPDDAFEEGIHAGFPDEGEAAPRPQAPPRAVYADSSEALHAVFGFPAFRGV